MLNAVCTFFSCEVYGHFIHTHNFSCQLWCIMPFKFDIWSDSKDLQDKLNGHAVDVKSSCHLSSLNSESRCLLPTPLQRHSCLMGILPIRVGHSCCEDLLLRIQTKVL